MPSLLERARVTAGDRDAGASEIARDLLPVLDQALQEGSEVVHDVVRLICATQPGMAPVWNACAMAVADLQEPGAFARFRQQMTRQGRTLTRVAAQAVAEVLDDSTEPTIVTWSYSASVAAALGEVARARPMTVICAEGRPRVEGRRLATQLADAGAQAVLTTDAGALAMLERAAAVVVGADALLSEQWVNKVGTRALAAVAAQLGQPVIVIAGRDKALAPSLQDRLSLLPGEAADVWPDPPANIECVSPIFERIPADLATWVATDAGLLTPSDLPAFVRRYEMEAGLLLSVLGRA